MYRTPLYNGHNFEVPMVSATESFTVLNSDFFFPSGRTNQGIVSNFRFNFRIENRIR